MLLILIMSEPYTYAKDGDFVYIYHAAVQNCNSYSNFTNACILLCIFMGGSGLATRDCSPLHKNGMCLALMTSLKWSSMYVGSCMSSALALDDKLECSSTRVKLLWWSLCICKVAILVSIIKAYLLVTCGCMIVMGISWLYKLVEHVQSMQMQYDKDDTIASIVSAMI